jgi:hypothetical protein
MGVYDPAVHFFADRCRKKRTRVKTQIPKAVNLALGKVENTVSPFLACLPIRGCRTFFLIKWWGSYFFLDKKVPKINCVEAPTFGNMQASLHIALT